MTEESYQQLRDEMVEQQLRARSISDPRVLEAMRRIPRHHFLPPDLQHLAYSDGPLPIGLQQTISQPYIVAYMTQLLALKPTDRVLEIGTGSGYQTAVLAELAQYVYSLERFARLAQRAGELLARLGYHNIDMHVGDGSQGLPDMAPFDAIIVTAAAPSLPGPLCTQLHPEGGRLVIPVGGYKDQIIQRVTRRDSRWQVEHLLPVRFVPLLGRYGFQSPPDEENDPAGSDDESGASV